MISVGKLSVMNESHTTGELKSLTEFVHLLAPNTGIKNKIEFKGKWNSRDSLEWSQMIRYGGLENLRGYRTNSLVTGFFFLPLSFSGMSRMKLQFLFFQKGQSRKSTILIHGIME